MSRLDENWNGIRDEAERQAPPKSSPPRETDEDWIHQHDAVKTIMEFESVMERIREQVESTLDPLDPDIDAANDQYERLRQSVPRELLNDFVSENPSAYYDGLYQRVVLSFWLKRKPT